MCIYKPTICAIYIPVCICVHVLYIQYCQTNATGMMPSQTQLLLTCLLLRSYNTAFQSVAYFACLVQNVYPFIQERIVNENRTITRQHMKMKIIGTSMTT